MVVREVLKECGFEFRLHIAANVADALKFLQNASGNEAAPCPGLVLLDLNLPGIFGIEVLKEIRSGARCNRIPVIVVTSSGSEEDRGAARKWGADAYFKKPTSLAAYLELAQVIHRVLRTVPPT